VRIVTDSSARLSAEWARANNVIVLPQHVQLNGKTIREDVDLSPEAFWEGVMREGKPFTVKPPTIEEFSSVFRELADAKADVISLHLSSALSPTSRNAAIAKDEVCGRCNINILDTRTMATGLNVLVKMTVALAEKGLPTDLIVKRLRGAMQNIYGIFISDDMEYLEASNRLRPAQALLGKMLEIIPCLSIEEGDLVAVEKVRSHERAIEKLMEFATEFDPESEFAFIQLSPKPNDKLDELIDLLKPSLPNADKIPIHTCGANVGSIIGRTGLGVMIVDREEQRPKS
jgi:DegV family protein with EDD domain